jgi:GxxExxY protein
MNEIESIIREVAEDVYRELGSGHAECVYDAAMQVGLRLRGMQYEGQKVVELTYRGHHVGEGYRRVQPAVRVPATLGIFRLAA